MATNKGQIPEKRQSLITSLLMNQPDVHKSTDSLKLGEIFKRT